MLWTLARAQKHAGHYVSVVLLNRGILQSRLESDSIPTTVLDEGHLNWLQLVVALRHQFRLVRPDVVHTHRTKENVLGATAAKLTQVPACVRTVHGDIENRVSWREPRRLLIGVIERVLVRLLHDATCAVSADLGRRERSRCLAGRVFVVPNGIDPVYVRQRAADPIESIPRTYGTIRVCAAGRLVQVKRLDIFLDSCALLRPLVDRPLDVYIVGDGPLRGYLESYARRYPDLKVTFVGFVENPAAWLATMDIVAITSDHEGLPMVLLEALALGVNVVCRAVGGIPAVLGGGARGLVASGDPADIAKEMLIQIHGITAHGVPCRVALPEAQTAVEMQRGYQRVYEECAPRTISRADRAEW